MTASPRVRASPECGYPIPAQPGPAPHPRYVVGAGMLRCSLLCPRGTGSAPTDPRGWKGWDLARFPREAEPGTATPTRPRWGVCATSCPCAPWVTFGVTPFLSLRFRLVSTVQATMATVSGITVVLSCKNVVYDR